MIVKQHEDNYVEAYKEHMLRVQVELIDYRKKTAEQYNKLKQDERTRFLEQSIHWMRSEAIKLCEQIEELK